MKKKILVSIIMLLFVVPKIIAGQEWDDSRNHEAMVFTGNSISRLETDSIKFIFLYSFHAEDNSWREITMQVDEIAPNVGYFGSSTDYNKTLDLDDEFVFMVQDAGDYAPPSSWIDDADSRNYIRHQFELVNPDNQLLKKYVYVYRSSTLSHDPSLPKYYIKYVTPTSGAADTVKAMSYLEGHNTKGIPDVWKVADSSGVYGSDFLDRQKARANGKYKWYLLSIDYKMTENDLIVSKFEYKRGPIRIIRNISYKAQLSGLEANIGTFQYRYYPYQIVSLGADKTLESEYGVKLIRQSFDLDSTAIGMKFYNADNANILIDGVEDIVNDTLYQSPVMNWNMHSGDPGTVVMLNEFTPPASSIYNLYYQESLIGETADGTKETGYDNRSYGDAGILFQAPDGGKITGAISLPYTTYFLPGVQLPEAGVALAHQTQYPVYKNVVVETFAVPSEIMISIADTSSPSLYPVSIPVSIGNTTGLDIKSCRLVIHFDANVLEAKNVSTTNTLAENWDVPAFSISNDTIAIEMSGATALQDSGALIHLNFNVIGSANQQSPLQIIQAKFNTWNPLANSRDGIFTALQTPEVTVKIPESSGISQSEVLIPIRVTNVTGLNIQRFVIELQFSKYILDALSVVNEGTLSSDWTNISFTDNIGSAKIEMSGTTPLEGSGTLIRIKFKVAGSAGQSTDITFRNMIFNDGVPFDKTEKGRFTVSNPILIEVFVTIPDTTIESLDTIHLPIRITEIRGLLLTGYQMDLAYDSKILQFLKVDTAATISSGWGNPVVISKLGDLSILADGENPLPGDGTLIYLNFNVVGADSSNTTVHFKKMTFNSGTYIANTKDGKIEVKGVVPVELSFFFANVINNSVELEWATATEQNNYGFFVEKSENSSRGWQSIGFVPGKGTTTVPQRYQYVDPDVKSGTWYYRLKQQDFDGLINYSSIVEANLAVPTKFAVFQNYPNPFNSSTMIRYDLAAGEHNVKIIIFDLLGHRIKTLFHENQNGGSYQIAWNGKDDLERPVATGIYFYHFHAGQTVFVKKMVLVE